MMEPSSAYFIQQLQQLRQQQHHESTALTTTISAFNHFHHEQQQKNTFGHQLTTFHHGYPDSRFFLPGPFHALNSSFVSFATAAAASVGHFHPTYFHQPTAINNSTATTPTTTAVVTAGATTTAYHHINNDEDKFMITSTASTINPNHHHHVEIIESMAPVLNLNYDKPKINTGSINTDAIKATIRQNNVQSFVECKMKNNTTKNTTTRNGPNHYRHSLKQKLPLILTLPENIAHSDAGSVVVVDKEKIPDESEPEEIEHQKQQFKRKHCHKCQDLNNNTSGSNNKLKQFKTAKFSSRFSSHLLSSSSSTSSNSSGFGSDGESISLDHQSTINSPDSPDSGVSSSGNIADDNRGFEDDEFSFSNYDDTLPSSSSEIDSNLSEPDYQNFDYSTSNKCEQKQDEHESSIVIEKESPQQLDFVVELEADSHEQDRLLEESFAFLNFHLDQGGIDVIDSLKNISLADADFCRNLFAEPSSTILINATTTTNDDHFDCSASMSSMTETGDLSISNKCLDSISSTEVLATASVPKAKFICNWHDCDWPGTYEDLPDHLREIHIELQPFLDANGNLIKWNQKLNNNNKNTELNGESGSQDESIEDESSDESSCAASARRSRRLQRTTHFSLISKKSSNGMAKNHHVVDKNNEQYVCLWQDCRVYGKPSSSRQWLERHVLEHSGPTPFKCIVDGCGQRFRTQNQLQKHVNMHFKTTAVTAVAESSSNNDHISHVTINNGCGNVILPNGFESGHDEGICSSMSVLDNFAGSKSHSSSSQNYRPCLKCDNNNTKKKPSTKNKFRFLIDNIGLAISRSSDESSSASLSSLTLLNETRETLPDCSNSLSSNSYSKSLSIQQHCHPSTFLSLSSPSTISSWSSSRTAVGHRNKFFNKNGKTKRNANGKMCDFSKKNFKSKTKSEFVPALDTRLSACISFENRRKDFNEIATSTLDASPYDYFDILPDGMFKKSIGSAHHVFDDGTIDLVENDRKKPMNPSVQVQVFNKKLFETNDVTKNKKSFKTKVSEPDLERSSEYQSNEIFENSRNESDSSNNDNFIDDEENQILFESYSESLRSSKKNGRVARKKITLFIPHPEKDDVEENLVFYDENQNELYAEDENDKNDEEFWYNHDDGNVDFNDDDAVDGESNSFSLEKCDHENEFSTNIDSIKRSVDESNDCCQVIVECRSIRPKRRKNCLSF